MTKEEELIEREYRVTLFGLERIPTLEEETDYHIRFNKQQNKFFEGEELKNLKKKHNQDNYQKRKLELQKRLKEKEEQAFKEYEEEIIKLEDEHKMKEYKNEWYRLWHKYTDDVKIFEEEEQQ